VILFVNGFNRSGTTVLQEAVAAATGGAALTVADLMRHGSPALAGRLRSIVESPEPVDRGVDRRRVAADTPEEYGWFLLDRAAAGRRSPRFEPAAAGHLRQITDAIVERSGVAVMKNPADFGQESQLLGSFPDAKVILVRRGLGAIADSSCRAVARLVRSRTYVLTLTCDSRWVRFVLWLDTTPFGPTLIKSATRWKLRLRLLSFLRTVSSLPLDRVAFLTYEELVEAPGDGSRWARHLLDSERLGKEFEEAHSHPRSPKPSRTPLVDRWLDRRWARAWAAMRAEQTRSGIL
jgi:hypothetical protein